MISDPKYIPCPNCKNAVLWSTSNPHRPFCSESCKNKDFIGWANEEKAMQGNALYDGILSGQLEDNS